MHLLLIGAVGKTTEGASYQHVEVCHATGTLIVPYWESPPFWPSLCPDGSGYASFVMDLGCCLQSHFREDWVVICLVSADLHTVTTTHVSGCPAEWVFN